VRTTRATVFAMLVCAGVAMSGARLDEPLRAAPAARRISVPGALPLTFERVRADVYTARSRGYDVKISRGSVVIALAAGESLPAAQVRLSFPNAASGVLVPEARVRAQGYLQGRRPEWRRDLRTYGRVRLSALHPGIDIVFYGSDRQLEHDIHIAPGARADQFAMAFEGVDFVGRDASGDLVVSAAGRQLTMRRPAAHQDVNGARTPVAVEFDVRDHTARLVLGEYDRTIPLIISPAP
jgi:hypothetical protein